MIARPRRVIGDKAYDSDRLDELLAAQGVEMIAPNRLNRSPTQDRRALRRCKRRWRVERTIAWLQNYRRLHAGKNLTRKARAERRGSSGDELHMADFFDADALDEILERLLHPRGKRRVVNAGSGFSSRNPRDLREHFLV